MRFSGLLILVVFQLVAGVPAAMCDLSPEVEVGVGYDDNIYREADGLNDAPFLTYDLATSFDILSTLSSELDVSLQARGLIFPHYETDGTQEKYDLRVDFDRRIVGRNRRKVEVPSLDVEIRGFARNRQRTDVSRITGDEAIEISESDTTALGGRFDSWVMGGATELSVRVLPSNLLKVEYRLLRRDYLEDYDDLPDVQSLDYDSWKWDLEIWQELGRHLRLKLEYALSQNNHDERLARDLAGDEVAGIARSFQYSTGVVSLESRRRDWGSWRLRAERRIRTDLFEGYYDCKRWVIEPMLRIDSIGPLDVELSYKYLHRDYERAYVANNPDRPVREDFERTLEADVAYRLGTSGAVFAHLTADNTDERNPAYSHDRVRVWMGYRYGDRMEGR
ncbi:MAG: hypothetical protein ABIK85_09835 [Candidatus Eisenbacteria bacterium]